MTKKITTLAAFVAAIGLLVPAASFAKTVAGRVTSVTPTSISVFDREIVRFGIGNQTVFTRLVTQKPWQQDTALTANALRAGGYVVVHVPEGTAVANWVQVATDFRNDAFVAEVRAPAVATVNGYAEPARHRAMAMALRAAPNASESKRPGSPGTALHCDRIADRLEKAAAPLAGFASPAPVAQATSGDVLSSSSSSTEVRDLIANAKTPADHRKLARHYTAEAARYEADAADHVAEAKAYRSAPTASESKRPGGPDTATHCDRLADAARNAATAARELARDHEQMAK